MTLTYGKTLAVDLVGPAGVVPEGFDAAVQVDEEGLQEGLPRVHSLQSLKKDGNLHHRSFDGN